MTHTLQELFDRSVSGVIAQGRQAKDTFAGCRYRTDNGLKCAVGQLIPDEDYSPAMEGAGVGGDSERAAMVRYAAGLENDEQIEMAQALQQSHDASAFHQSFLDSFKLAALVVARRYGLDPKVAL